MKHNSWLLSFLPQIIRLLLVVSITLFLLTLFWPWLEQIRYSWDAEPRTITARGDLAADEQSTIELFQRTSPSVVYITTLSRRIDPWTRNVLQIPRGTGSGFVWDQQGHIVTNFHVLENASAAQVTLNDHSVYDAALIGASPDHDLAVLRISTPLRRLEPVAIGTAQDLQVGQKVFAIGNPFGLDQTLTTGIVSALDRTIEGSGNRPIEHVIQTDAAINPGNSGGPLLDSAGRLIGVNTAIFSPSGAYAGIGFAVPVDTVNRVVPQIIARGRYIKPDLGIVADDRISRALSRQTGVEGLLILSVKSGSAADAAGLRGTVRAADGSIIPGDILQRIDDLPVRTVDDLFSALDNYDLGDRIEVTVLRPSGPEQLSILLE